MKLDLTIEEKKEILTSSIALHWLRPEVGLALTSFSIFGCNFYDYNFDKSLDLACGDGTTLFLRLGGRFDFGFDVYQMGIKKNMTHQEIAKHNIDVFDSYKENSLSENIAKKANIRVAYGLDKKENMLKKAKELSFYNNLKLADMNKPLPIKDESLSLCFSNALYWVKDPVIPLNEIKKKLTNNGVVILEVMTSEIEKEGFINKYSVFGSRWAELLDRGRLNNHPGLKSELEWENIFTKNGFKIEAVYDVFPYVIYQIWNIGLRPIFPILQKIISYLPDEKYLEIKREWVENIVDLSFPVLMQSKNELWQNKPKFRLQYVLRKVEQ